MVAAAGNRLSAALWESAATIYDAILHHPFIVGLTDGSLPRESFQFYVVQDSLYLNNYARALSIAAARAPSPADIQMFNEHAAGAIVVERTLHESFFKEFGLSVSDVAATPLAPTNQAYCSFLLATAYQGSYAELLGAILPCYCIYWEVGKELGLRGSTDPLYQRWIDLYSDPAFGKLVQAVIDLSDRVGSEISSTDSNAAIAAFRTTARYEWMFWDMGYRCEQWPVS